jgi:uncharacterized protein YbaA (DUF1428 family)
MRERVDRARLQAFMRALAEAARRPLQVFGATAVLEGWRDSTIDIDLGSFRRAVEAVTGTRVESRD